MSKFTKTADSMSGRIAALARSNETSPWVQIESCSDGATARNYLDHLEHDEEARKSLVEEMNGESWDDDTALVDDAS